MGFRDVSTSWVGGMPIAAADLITVVDGFSPSDREHSRDSKGVSFIIYIDHLTRTQFICTYKQAYLVCKLQLSALTLSPFVFSKVLFIIVLSGCCCCIYILHRGVTLARWCWAMRSAHSQPASIRMNILMLINDRSTI